MCIATGRTSDETANVEDSKMIGREVLVGMTGQAVSDVHSNKENEARTMNTKPSVKIGEEKVRVDPQLLFQRLLHVAGGDLTKLAEIFRYELTAVPASLFDDSGFMRESSKYLLAKHLWNSEFEADLTKEERLHLSMSLTGDLCYTTCLGPRVIIQTSG